MKRLLLTTALLTASSLSIAATNMPVSEALAAHDNTQATLTGTLGQSLGNERYQFRDTSGQIIVEIDHDITRHIALKDGQNVTLYGEIEKEHGDNEFEVDFLEIH